MKTILLILLALAIGLLLLGAVIAIEAARDSVL